MKYKKYYTKNQFVDHCLFFFFFLLSIALSVLSIYGFWLAFWYLQIYIKQWSCTNVQKILKSTLWRKTSYEVITKLPNTEQSSKGKSKTHKSTNRQNQSTTGKLGKPQWFWLGTGIGGLNKILQRQTFRFHYG